jgi:hypothetical protein
MPSIPIDVLQEILEHVRKADLPTLCKVNKIFCSCSQDVLYRNIAGDIRVIQTLAQSTDLARRVRSFYYFGSCPELAMALRNMSSLRKLNLRAGDVLDGCTFKLYSFSFSLRHTESIQIFLTSQPTLTNLTIWGDREPLPPFDERCLPNLTRVEANSSLLRALIPGRPVREVTMISSSGIDSTDLSFFTLSTTPIQKLWIHFEMVYPKPVPLLVSIFPSLVYLEFYAYRVEWTVRVTLCSSI